MSSLRKLFQQASQAAPGLRTGLQSPQRDLVCSSEGEPEVVRPEPLSGRDALALKIHCFAWTVRSAREELLLNYARWDT